MFVVDSRPGRGLTSRCGPDGQRRETPVCSGIIWTIWRRGSSPVRVLTSPQLNIMRGIERRKPQEILSVRQNFDPQQFNFNKINPKELLFELQKPRDARCHQNGSKSKCKVIINVSPLEFGHCLLVTWTGQVSPADTDTPGGPDGDRIGPAERWSRIQSRF